MRIKSIIFLIIGISVAVACFAKTNSSSTGSSIAKGGPIPPGTSAGPWHSIAGGTSSTGKGASPIGNGPKMDGISFNNTTNENNGSSDASSGTIVPANNGS